MLDNQNVLEACGKRGGGSCAPVESDPLPNAQLFEQDQFVLVAAYEFFENSPRVLH